MHEEVHLKSLTLEISAGPDSLFESVSKAPQGDDVMVLTGPGWM